MAKKKSPGRAAKPASQDPLAEAAPGRTEVTGGRTAESGGSSRELEVVVTLQESAVDRIDEVARKLRSAGMIVDQKLALLGQCVGRSPASLLNTLRNVAGVDTVETTARYQLPDDPSAPQ